MSTEPTTAWRSWAQRDRWKRDRSTIEGRARALAQEMVIFGRLRGSQWDGLTTVLVVFAESELARQVKGTRHRSRSRSCAGV